jgi:hypothetical protein
VQQDVLISKVGRACRFFLLVLSFNRLGEGLRDALDPKHK